MVGKLNKQDDTDPFSMLYERYKNPSLQKLQKSFAMGPCRELLLIFKTFKVGLNKLGLIVAEKLFPCNSKMPKDGKP